LAHILTTQPHCHVVSYLPQQTGMRNEGGRNNLGDRHPRAIAATSRRESRRYQRQEGDAAASALDRPKSSRISAREQGYQCMSHFTIPCGDSQPIFITHLIDYELRSHVSHLSPHRLQPETIVWRWRRGRGCGSTCEPTAPFATAARDGEDLYPHFP